MELVRNTFINAWYPIIGIKDSGNSEGLMVTREIKFSELQMEYVCIPNNVLEKLRELIAY